jgi:hypothetical protein
MVETKLACAFFRSGIVFCTAAAMLGGSDACSRVKKVEVGEVGSSGADACVGVVGSSDGSDGSVFSDISEVVGSALDNSASVDVDADGGVATG